MIGSGFEDFPIWSSRGKTYGQYNKIVVDARKMMVALSSLDRDRVYEAFHGRRNVGEVH